MEALWRRYGYRVENGWERTKGPPIMGPRDLLRAGVVRVNWPGTIKGVHMQLRQAGPAAHHHGDGDSRGLAAETGAMEIRFRAGEAYEVAVRDHTLVVDQPTGVGGEDAAPTPTELFVASLATCVAFYAGRYLTRHGYDRDGLGVRVDYELATDRPARVSRITMTLLVPTSVPQQRWAALHAVASHCTVHNSITTPPAVAIDLRSSVAHRSSVADVAVS